MEEIQTKQAKNKALVIISGGLDSSTLLAVITDLLGYDEVEAVSFLYGQRHSKELAFAAKQCRDRGINHTIIDIGTIGLSLNSSLTQMDQEVPEGHYEAESMKATVVPNRNAIMLAIAWGIAQSKGCSVVAIGAHNGDHAIYPDCRPEFMDAAQTAFNLGTDEQIVLLAPFIESSKADIARDAYQLNVDVANTWSCYKGGEFHCGKCGTCVERKEAFLLAQVPDPTIYEDSSFGVEHLLETQPEG